MRLLSAILLLIIGPALSGCAGFKLGSVMYCASATACTMRADPFRPVETVPPGGEGAAGAIALPLVK